MGRDDSGALEICLGRAELIMRSPVNAVVGRLHIAHDFGHVGVERGLAAKIGHTAIDIRRELAGLFVSNAETRRVGCIFTHRVRRHSLLMKVFQPTSPRRGPRCKRVIRVRVRGFDIRSDDQM
jgi:hypothetical protein